MELEIYRDCDPHPAIVNYRIEVNGYWHTMTRDLPKAGIIQIVLEGPGQPTPAQKEFIGSFTRMPGVKVYYFFDLPTD